MGISVGILAATDEQIRGFADDVSGLEKLFSGVTSNPRACHLHDFWDGLHFVLTAETGEALPLAAINRGDLHYRGVGDPTHAIFAATTTALAQQLSALSAPVLRARFDPPRMLRGPDGAMVYPGRLWTPGGEDRVFSELMHYFNRLRDYTAAAARIGNGLLFSRYEDW
jgi:Domain of unknown function (DUF1877)